MKKRLLLLGTTVVVGAATVRRYRRDEAAAWARLAAVDRKVVPSPFGDIEYAVVGKGEPVVVVHGILGGADAGLTSFGDLLPERRVVAPSRFGYLGSAMPDGATPELQADAFAALLDHLGIRRADVVGFSAGATSVLCFALRHRDRCAHVVILSGNLPGPTAVAAPRLAGLLMASNVGMWLSKVLAGPGLARLMGVPKGLALRDETRATIERVRDSIFPVGPRAAGVLFDAHTSNPAVNHLPLDQIGVPTLIVHARDDPLASFDAAWLAAQRIPGARMVTLERGGHLLLGQDSTVRAELEMFLAETPTVAP